MTYVVSARRRRSLAVLSAACSLVLIGAGAAALSQSARAALVDAPSTGDARGVVLSSARYPAPVPDLIPGHPAFWQVGVRLEDVSRASLSLELRKSGDLVTHPAD